MIHSASPQTQSAVMVAWLWSFGTDRRTETVITTSRGCGRPCGSTTLPGLPIVSTLLGGLVNYWCPLHVKVNLTNLFMESISNFLFLFHNVQYTCIYVRFSNSLSDESGTWKLDNFATLLHKHVCLCSCAFGNWIDSENRTSLFWLIASTELVRLHPASYSPEGLM